jgi:hypothetical protein
MKYRKLTAGVIAGAAALLAGLGSGVVQAAPVKPAALPVTQSVTTTLPMIGTPLSISFTTGPGGVLTTADIVGTGTNTATVSPNHVSFTTDPGGTGVKVSVKSKGNTQSINARVDSLAKFENPAGGTWAGVVFGDANASSPVQDVVTYHISDSTGNGLGDPMVSIDDPITTLGDVGATAVVTQGVLKVGEEGQKSSIGTVVFTNSDKTLSRTLTIAASVRTIIPEADDDETTTSVSAPPATPPTPVTVASLRITLSGTKALPQDLATLAKAGTQMYNTFLCDGTAASFGYLVDAQGNLTFDSTAPITPAASDSKANGNKLEVRWPTGERVRLQAKVNGTQVTIQVRERIRCKGAPDPTITGASVVPNNGEHHGGHDGKGNGGGGDD